MIFENTNLSVFAFTPNIVASGTNVTYTPRGTQWEELTKKINGWQSVISLSGGFLSADFSLTASFEEAERWFTSGLGKHIELISPSLDVRWEGFVNSISVEIGGFVAPVGPMLDVVNRTSCPYSVLDTSVDPPVAGITTTTVLANDTDSHLAYGILEDVVPLGQTLTVLAEEIRDLHLVEQAWIRPNCNIDFGEGAGEEIKVGVKCLGYIHFLNKAIYNNPTATGTITVSSTATSKLQNILGGATGSTITPNANPNELFSVNNSTIESNASLVHAYENENRTGLQIIQELASVGSGTQSQVAFGVYADREFIYEFIPTDVAYRTAMSDNARRVEHLTGGEIAPWDVDVNRWLMIADFLLNTQINSNDTLRSDPRNIYAQEITFVAPNRLSINGGAVQTFTQLLAYYGLLGMI